MLTNLHSPLKDEISPISTDDEFSRTGRKAALTTQQAWRLQSISVFEGFFFFNMPRQTDSFLNPLRCRRCRNLQSLIPLSCLSPRLLQGWPPSVGRVDIPRGMTEDLCWNGWCPSEKFKRSPSPFLKISMWITSLWRLGCNYCMMGLCFDWIRPGRAPSSSHGERRGRMFRPTVQSAYPITQREPREALIRFSTHVWKKKKKPAKASFMPCS